MCFIAEQKIVAEKLEIEYGWNVIQCIYDDETRNKYMTRTKIEILGRLHKAQIDICDAIFVVNVDGYISESTKVKLNILKCVAKKFFSLNKWMNKLMPSKYSKLKAYESGYLFRQID